MRRILRYLPWLIIIGLIIRYQFFPSGIRFPKDLTFAMRGPRIIAAPVIPPQILDRIPGVVTSEHGTVSVRHGWVRNLSDKILRHEPPVAVIEKFTEKAWGVRYSLLSVYRERGVLDVVRHDQADSSMTRYVWPMPRDEKDFRLDLDQVTGDPRLSLPRDLFDAPRFGAGWSWRDGAFAAAKGRAWRFEFRGKAFSEGVDGEMTWWF